MHIAKTRWLGGFTLTPRLRHGTIFFATQLRSDPLKPTVYVVILSLTEDYSSELVSCSQSNNVYLIVWFHQNLLSVTRRLMWRC